MTDLKFNYETSYNKYYKSVMLEKEGNKVYFIKINEPNFNFFYEYTTSFNNRTISITRKHFLRLMEAYLKRNYTIMELA